MHRVLAYLDLALEQAATQPYKEVNVKVGRRNKAIRSS